MGDDPVLGLWDGIADFYRERLGMDLFHQDPDGSHFLTDGYVNLALIQQRLDGDVATGFNHFGFAVDEIDPEGNWFDLSAHGFLPPGVGE